tara:strand:+ start:293 stop:418 length:126 start_codon:yes stop_codon:yes gene_type:complete
MDIKNLVTKEQYDQLKKDYAAIVKNNEITFFDFCTKTYKLI